MLGNDYRGYLKSENWQLRRRIALRRSGYRCQKCASGRSLHVHHNTYMNVGNEPMKDLIVLCENCHEMEHLRLAVKKRIAEQERRA